MPLDILEKTRELVKTKSKRRFELVAEILTHEAMMTMTPTRLMWELIYELKISEQEFPVSPFRQFVSQYRKKMKKKGKGLPEKKEKEMTKPTIVQHENKEVKYREERKKISPNDTWLNFKFTDPATLKKEPEATLKKVPVMKKISTIE